MRRGLHPAPAEPAKANATNVGPAVNTGINPAVNPAVNTGVNASQQRNPWHNPRNNPPSQTGRRLPWVFLLPALVTALAVLVPLGYLLLRALEADPAALRETVWRLRNLELLANTLLLTIGVLVASTLIALPLAWLTTRSDLPARRWLGLLGVLPLAIPGYVGAYALLAATGHGGVIEVLAGINFPRPTGYFGALGILTLFGFPYLYLNLQTALRGLDPSLEEAARSLGQRPWAVFWTVVLPQLRPALLAGALLLGLHVLGDFGVVSLMRFETFSYAIYLQYSAAFDRVYAAWLSLMLLALTGGALLLEARLLAGLRLARLGAGAARQPQPLRLGHWRWLALLFVALLAGAALLVPLGTILYWLLHSLLAAQGQAQLLARLGPLAEALGNSLLAAAPAALCASGLALPLAYLGVRFPGVWSRLLGQSAYLGYATPPLALALAFIFFTLRVLPDLYQTLALLVLALALHFLAEAIGPIRAALYQVPANLEEAARSLGLRPTAAFVRTTLPLVWRGVTASLALVFLSVLKELPLNFLLSPVGFDTLAKQVWGLTNEAMFAEAAPYALTIVLAAGMLARLTLTRDRQP
jgi:iron(III) transport system permease protein